MVVWYGTLAIGGLWVLLRLTGVIGPLISAHGL
jgi:hypothetical protein